MTRHLHRHLFTVTRKRWHWTSYNPETDVDMLPEMLEKSRGTAQRMGLEHVEFREGILEEIPAEDGWADAVISNGVINLCADKKQVFGELWRVLRPGGVIQFADIANGKPVPEAAVRNIDLWTA